MTDHTNATTSSSSESPSPFKVLDVVLAKFGAHWWPAQIIDPKEHLPPTVSITAPSPNHILVYFFGSHNFAYVQPKQVRLKSNTKERPTRCGQRLKYAFIEAEVVQKESLKGSKLIMYQQPPPPSTKKRTRNLPHSTSTSTSPSLASQRSVRRHLEYFSSTGDAPSDGQWVTRVIAFSSQHRNIDCNANQLIGKPLVFPKSGEHSGVWSPSSINRGSEFLELEFDIPVFVCGVQVYEIQNPGTVAKISVRDYHGGWYPVWTRKEPVVSDPPSDEAESVVPDPPNDEAVIFCPWFMPPEFKSNAVRLDLDTKGAVKWTQIDAVKLLGGTRSAESGYCVSMSWKSSDEIPRPPELMATYPIGVIVKSSTLNQLTHRTAGNGLFAVWGFKKGDHITEYDGPVEYMPRCNHRYAAPHTSHFRRIENSDFVIHGLKVPVSGRGAASFVNDCCDFDRSRVNARLKTLKLTATKEIHGSQKTVILPIVVLKAVSDIAPDEEIFTDYTAATRKRLGIQRDRKSNTSSSNKTEKTVVESDTEQIDSSPTMDDLWESFEIPPLAPHWKTNHPYVGVRVHRSGKYKTYLWETEGLVVGWVPDTETEAALWHVVHVDGDEEDLSKSEVEQAIAMYKSRHDKKSDNVKMEPIHVQTGGDGMGEKEEIEVKKVVEESAMEESEEKNAIANDQTTDAIEESNTIRMSVFDESTEFYAIEKSKEMDAIEKNKVTVAIEASNVMGTTEDGKETDTIEESKEISVIGEGKEMNAIDAKEKSGKCDRNE
eukprot:c7581_g1_i1.p1 GENE.c7581_g1_i1~~c7581_g1_i1.p1  ORF type:complete len:770 (+),score=205.62 c7581_g1_i1:44-2353(+)